jgi:hypothetical protein
MEYREYTVRSPKNLKDLNIYELRGTYLQHTHGTDWRFELDQSAKEVVRVRPTAFCIEYGDGTQQIVTLGEDQGPLILEDINETKGN